MNVIVKIVRRSIRSDFNVLNFQGSEGRASPVNLARVAEPPNVLASTLSKVLFQNAVEPAGPRYRITSIFHNCYFYVDPIVCMTALSQEIQFWICGIATEGHAALNMGNSRHIYELTNRSLIGRLEALEVRKHVVPFEGTGGRNVHSNRRYRPTAVDVEANTTSFNCIVLPGTNDILWRANNGFNIAYLASESFARENLLQFRGSRRRARGWRRRYSDRHGHRSRSCLAWRRRRMVLK